jgi:hypothetical protein
MKKSLVVAALLLASSSVFAAETSDAGKWFVGIGMTNGGGTETGTLTGGGVSFTGEFDFDSKSVPLTIGYITNSNNRAKLTFQTIKADWDNGGSDKFSGMDFDFDWTIESWKTNNILPYAGIGIGVYTFEDTAQYYADNEDLRGVALNMNAGILYQANNNLEFEAGYKYKSITWEESYYYSGSTRVNLELDEKISSLYLGLNYKF